MRTAAFLVLGLVALSACTDVTSTGTSDTGTTTGGSGGASAGGQTVSTGSTSPAGTTTSAGMTTTGGASGSGGASTGTTTSGGSTVSTGGTTTTTTVGGGTTTTGGGSTTGGSSTTTGGGNSGPQTFVGKGDDCTCADCDPHQNLACVDDQVLGRFSCVSMCQSPTDCTSDENCENLGSFSACFPKPQAEVDGCNSNADCGGPAKVCVDYFGKQCRTFCEPKATGNKCEKDEECAEGLTCVNGACEGKTPCLDVPGSGCYEVTDAGGQTTTACMVVAQEGQTCGNGSGTNGGNPTQLCNPDNTAITCAMTTDRSGFCRHKCSGPGSCPPKWTCMAIGGTSDSVCVPESPTAGAQCGN